MSGYDVNETYLEIVRLLLPMILQSSFLASVLSVAWGPILAFIFTMVEI
jgi:hypothetical protein